MESENKYINKVHEAKIEEYVLYLKKLVYFATEDAGSRKFFEFSEILLETLYLHILIIFTTQWQDKDI